jgi:pimeloyl-ACP methyl ester carboxylesterase
MLSVPPSPLDAGDAPLSLSPACPRSTGVASEPDCSRRLILRECLERWRDEAEHGEVDTGRYRCPYVAWGRGPNLVFIPGMASDAISFVMPMARLQQHFRCISYDLPAGEDDGARLMRYRHDDLVADLLFLCDHLGIRESFLCGSSFGSTIALAALHRQPQRFPRGILQGGFAHRSLTQPEVFFGHWARFLPGRLGDLRMIKSVIERIHRQPFLGREPEVWDFFVDRQARVPLRAFASRALMLHRLDLRSILPALQQSVLMICGDSDPLVGPTCQRELMQGLHFITRAEIEQCGHQPHLTHPEVLAEIVRQFLS